MKYKLIVLDVDGTLLNSNREITKRTIQTLRRVQQMGIRIALASGRPTYGILPWQRPSTWMYMTATSSHTTAHK